jgi:hypothetical protein
MRILWWSKEGDLFCFDFIGQRRRLTTERGEGRGEEGRERDRER